MYRINIYSHSLVELGNCTSNIFMVSFSISRENLHRSVLNVTFSHFLLVAAASESSTVSGVSSASSTVKRSTNDNASSSGNSKAASAQQDGEKDGSNATSGGGATGEPSVEGEDTMKNLRKTFAGIFGEIN